MTLQKYLEAHAEPAVAAWLNALPSVEASVSVVIPACCESQLLPGALDALAPDALAIVVVNGRRDAPDAVHAENAEVLSTLNDRASCRPLTPDLALGRWPGGPLLALVDRTSASRRLGPRSGVGEARKLGADLAAGIALRGGPSWIFSTDADARLPDIVGPLTALGTDVVAVSWPYRHDLDPRTPADLSRALALYELSMRHYTGGLRRASSPYAFPTLGSAIAVRASAYAAVRGFPKRQAGEDFYLLNKLAKLGGVAVPAAPPVRLVGRPSGRVPFGTGPAMRRIAVDGPERFDVYSPRVFDVVGALLDALGDPCVALSAGALARSVAETLGDDALAGPVQTELGRWSKGLAHIARHGTTRERRRHHAMTYVDAFRTMKLIHHLRDTALPNVPWHEVWSVSAQRDPWGLLEEVRVGVESGYVAGLRSWSGGSSSSS